MILGRFIPNTIASAMIKKTKRSIPGTFSVIGLEVNSAHAKYRTERLISNSPHLSPAANKAHPKPKSVAHTAR